MIFTETKLKGAFIIELERREDERGSVFGERSPGNHLAILRLLALRTIRNAVA